MITFPNAKINLGLNIVKKRNDGYHNIETVFYPVNICDALELVVSESETTFTTSGMKIKGDDADNLVLKAYRLLSEQYHLPNINIHLHKKIPMEAGLGGGSADAAFMLKLINNYFQLNIDDDTLAKYASKIGADCAFFIYNRPMYGCGKGDELSDINIDLKGRHLLLISSNVHVSTAEAYRHCTPHHWDIPVKEVIKKPIHEWKNLLYNDFEQSVFQNHEILQNIKETLYSFNAEYAAMSGSGSTLYGIFDKEPETDIITRKLQSLYPENNITTHHTIL